MVLILDKVIEDFEIKLNIDKNLIYDYEKYQKSVDPTKFELGIVEEFVDKQIKNNNSYNNKEDVDQLISKVLVKREEGINYKDFSTANDLIFLEKNKYLLTPERINYNIDEKLFVFLARQFN